MVVYECIQLMSIYACSANMNSCRSPMTSQSSCILLDRPLAIEATPGIRSNACQSKTCVSGQTNGVTIEDIPSGTVAKLTHALSLSYLGCLAVIAAIASMKLPPSSLHWPTHGESFDGHVSPVRVSCHHAFRNTLG